jgi:two-component system chemotaxis sensor kinase CheA
MTEKNQKKAVTEFLAESEDILEEIGNLLVQLEEGRKTSQINPEVVNGIFRGAHSLKGLSGMLGFSRVSELSHHLENMLDALRLGKLDLDNSVLDCLFESLDTLNRMVVQIGEEGNDEFDIDGAMESINSVLNADGSNNGASESPLEQMNVPTRIQEVLTEYEEHRLLENIRQQANIYEIRVTFGLTTFDEDLQNVTKGLSEKGEIITTLPSTGDAPESVIQFNLIVASQEGKGALENIVAFHKGAVSEIEYVKEQPNTSGTEKSADGTASSESVSFGNDVKGLTRTVRVDIKKLDTLMNAVGELTQTKNVLQGRLKEMRKQEGLSSLAGDLQKSTDTLERKIAELQDGVLEIRMTPIGQIFNRLSRSVRKLSKASNKEINFTTRGEDTELDKMVIEEIADPLMHIIRNAIDHGIESPDERKRLGKPAEGTIHLGAYQKGNHVVVDVEDDGDGIDLAKVLSKALEAGLVEKDEMLNEEQILNLLFLPGFSTAEQVSEVSGRGVGMDVVKKNIASLGGMVDIRTEVGKGSCFTINLPITLAIIPALIVRCSEQIYAIPLNAVSETLIVSDDVLETVENKEVIKLRDRILSLLRLQEIFRLPSLNGNGNKDKTHIVVVGLAEKKIGIVVDGFVDKQEIVIKPIGKTLKKIPGIAGATEMGNKRAILVLDVGSLIEEATQGVMTE